MSAGYVQIHVLKRFEIDAFLRFGDRRRGLKRNRKSERHAVCDAAQNTACVVGKYLDFAVFHGILVVVFAAEKCSGCKACAEFNAFNARNCKD